MSNQKVTPSSLTDSFLPSFINEQYATFVTFMTKAAESEERTGFGQDILQNLQNYRNFDQYKDKIVQFGVLKGNLAVDGDELTLEDGFGFPLENGVLLIDDEVVLYRTREENTLYGLQRGASGTTVLPTLRTSGTYLETVAAAHSTGVKVTNLSVLFLVAILSNIHDSYTPNIDWQRVNEDVNRSSLLQNVKDFFASKGSNLGVASLFKILFGEDQIRVVRPGDRMFKPSTSTWNETLILRSEPFPAVLSNPLEPYTTPDNLTNSIVTFLSYNDDTIHGRFASEYVSSYPHEGLIQYEFYISKDTVSGDIPVNPSTKLTRQLEAVGVNNNLLDVFTITVESTVGFPSSGVIFIESEGIYYSSKTQNQFIGCTRGYIGVDYEHQADTTVYGPYYLKGSVVRDGITHTSYSWPLSCAAAVRIDNQGLLALTDSEITINGPGDTDPSSPVFSSFVVNTSDTLVTQTNTLPNMGYVADRTAGVSGLFFDDNYAAVTSSNLPYYTIGPFSTDDSVGPDLVGVTDIHAIPRKLTENTDNTGKNTGTIGVSIDGVPIYSNESPDNVVSGAISSIAVTKPGNGYRNPTVIISPGGAEASATVVNGQITAVEIDTNDTFYADPTIVVSGGQGATFNLSFDNYGRLIGIIITNGGLYYNDIPVLELVDASGRGKGALVACAVSGGSIITVTIVESGIDYAASATTLVATPVGSGAQLVASVEHFVFDRMAQIQNNPNWTLDSGNGFLYEDEDGVRSRFGYIVGPALGPQTGDSVLHSPILGWAFDGNPIYGPFAYSNGVDSSGGITRQISGYVLETDRSSIKASGGTGVATLPPSTTTYPMGSFIEDYTYDPVQAAALRNGRLLAENDDFLQSEAEDYINQQTSAAAVLGRTNGKVCNTPDFPAELYPNGVFCYFIATFGEEHVYPYVIGPKFQNQPLSQNIIVTNGGPASLSGLNEANYDDSEITINYSTVSRYRNPQLSPTKDEVEIELGTLLTGEVSGLLNENSLPATTSVGDKIFFDDSDTLGAGVAAVVEFVGGNAVTEAEGSEVTSILISHTQRINIGDSAADYAFPSSTQLTSAGGVIFEVISFDYTTGFLDVFCTGTSLIKFGDTIFDAAGVSFVIPSSAEGIVIDDKVVGGLSTFISYTQPTSTTASAGDLWWSSYNGKLYVYYDDGVTSQWVTTQPMGMRPFVGATDTPIGTTTTTPQAWASLQSSTVISMAELAPSSRSDGSQNQRGDLWWSTHTGMLYIWSGDNTNTFDAGTLQYTSEWISTDPTASVSTEGSSAEYQYQSIVTGDIVTYSQSVQVLISQSSPSTMSNGTQLVPGTLWWSPLNGKMYIYYEDADTSQWVVTNPTGVLSSQYGLNTIPVGDGGVNPDFVSILPEPPNRTTLFFESIEHFFEGDDVLFSWGAPDTEGTSQTSTILNIGEGNSLKFERTYPLDNGVKISNTSRYLYTIKTQDPHTLRRGDSVKLTSTTNPELNGVHSVIQGGAITPAVGTGTISGGAVTAATLSSPGRGYANDVYVQFVGGGGVGAYGIARVDPEAGGVVSSIEIVEGGVNYTTQPVLKFPTGNTINEFSIYTDKKYPSDSSLTFGAGNGAAIGTTYGIKLQSGGQGYNDLPKFVGIEKRSGEGAKCLIVLDGTTIGEIQVLKPGIRYTNPIAHIVDITGSGYGATAEVFLDGQGVSSVIVTNPGTNYVEPFIYILESDGKVICLTENIGRIASFDVTNPGRNISADKALNPEIQIETRLVIGGIDGGSFEWQVGDTVFQGTTDYRLNTATVTNWDTDRQILTIESIDGEIFTNKPIYNERLSSGTVLVNGQAKAAFEIAGMSSVAGRFVNEEGIVSSEYSVIQDSEYFQWFSYEIHSPIQQIEYETFVTDLIHPAGFAMFSAVSVDETITTVCSVEDIDI